MSEENTNNDDLDPFQDEGRVEHIIGEGTQLMHEGAVKALRYVFDPEISVNIYDLGLIYKIETRIDGTVLVQMTLTSPNCPEADTLPVTAQSYIGQVPGVEEVIIDLVWEPAWGHDRMSDATRLSLGFL